MSKTPGPEATTSRSRGSAARRRRPGRRRPRFRPLVGLAAAALAVTALYVARAVLIPVALAGLLTFLLSPVVSAFERRLHRAVAVTLVAGLVFSALGVLTWVVVNQIQGLEIEIPRYRENLKRKIAEVRGAGRGGVLEQVQSATKEVVEEIQKKDAEPGKPADRPVPVVVKEDPGAIWQLPALLEVLGNIALVLVLVIFMLLEREDLRDRFIRLVGVGRLTRTTQAMDEAGRRIGHYLRMQTLINGTFGLGIALGTWLLDLPYAFLAGVLAGVFRFIPYVGPWLGAGLVCFSALAVFPGWVEPLAIVGLFVALELFSNLVMETYLYSQSAGVSQVALLVAVAFWTWLWGPVGLALATPLTVCLVVMGKYVPRLRFISTLLSDEQPARPDVGLYHRLLLAADPARALDYVRPRPWPAVHDEVILPALARARADRRRGRIANEDEQTMWRATREIVAALAPPSGVAAPFQAGPGGQPGPAEGARLVRVLGLPVRDEGDALAFEMLRQPLDPTRWSVTVTPPALLASEAFLAVETEHPDVVCLGSLVGDRARDRARYLCKRLRARFPGLWIVVGVWGRAVAGERTRTLLLAAGADRVAATLAATSAQLQELGHLGSIDSSQAPRDAPTRRTRQGVTTTTG